MMVLELGLTTVVNEVTMQLEFVPPENEASYQEISRSVDYANDVIGSIDEAFGELVGVYRQ